MKERPRLLDSEDWVAVWIGFLSLALVLAGVRPELPAFGWANEGDWPERSSAPPT